jgi:hypothetical protein
VSPKVVERSVPKPRGYECLLPSGVSRVCSEEEKDELVSLNPNVTPIPLYAFG